MGQGNWLCGFKFQFFPKDTPRYDSQLYKPIHAIRSRPRHFAQPTPAVFVHYDKRAKNLKNAKITIDNPGGPCYSMTVDRATAHHTEP